MFDLKAHGELPAFCTRAGQSWKTLVDVSWSIFDRKSQTSTAPGLRFSHRKWRQKGLKLGKRCEELWFVVFGRYCRIRLGLIAVGHGYSGTHYRMRGRGAWTISAPACQNRQNLWRSSRGSLAWENSHQI